MKLETVFLPLVGLAISASVFAEQLSPTISVSEIPRTVNGDFFVGLSDEECDEIESLYVTGEKSEIPLGDVRGYIEPQILGHVEILDASDGASRTPLNSWGRYFVFPTDGEWFVSWQEIDPVTEMPVVNCGARNTLKLITENGFERTTDCVVFTGDFCSPFPIYTINSYGYPGYLIESYTYNQ